MHSTLVGVKVEVGIFCIIIIIIICSFSFCKTNNVAFAQNTSETASFAVSVHTDNVKYVAGTPIRISGAVYPTSQISPNNPYYKSIPIVINTTAQFYTGFLGTCVFNDCIPSQGIISTSATVARDGSYSLLLTPISEPGFYQITASISPEFKAISHPSAIIIEIQDLFFTRTFLILYIGLGIGLVGLTIVVLKAPSIFPPPSSEEVTSGGQRY